MYLERKKKKKTYKVNDGQIDSHRYLVYKETGTSRFGHLCGQVISQGKLYNNSLNIKAIH